MSIGLLIILRDGDADKVEFMPFYTKRAKIKHKIRAMKMDSGEYAEVGKKLAS